MAAPTIIQLFRTYFTSDFYVRAGEILGENSYKTEKALSSAILPLIAGSMLKQAVTGAESNAELYELCVEAEKHFLPEHDYSILEKNPAQTASMTSPEVLSKISEYAGISSDSVSILLSFASLSAYGLIGKHIQRNKLSPSGLAGYLSFQEDAIADALPASLVFLKDSLEISKVFSVQKKWDYSSQKFPSLAWKRGRRILIAGLVILAALAVYLFFIR